MAVNFVGMLTKYVLTIGVTEYEIPDECLKNWDEISFSLKRTDYSGVMRSYSTEFVFVGDIKDKLWELYLADGFRASASVAVYTITNAHTWAKQYEAALDFSTVQMENGTLSISALDNSLASLLKSKKSQKYEYPVADFAVTQVEVSRMEIANYALFDFSNTYQSGLVELQLNSGSSAVISQEYIEPQSVQDSSNSFFALCKKHGIRLMLTFRGKVRCYFCPYITEKNPDGTKVPAAEAPDTGKFAVYADNQLEDENFQRLFYMSFDDRLQYKRIHGIEVNMLVNGTHDNVFISLQALQAAAQTRFGSNISADYNGIFGVVGRLNNAASYDYWQQNTVYEYQNGSWYDKGAPEDYYQDRDVNEITMVSDSNLWVDTHVRLSCENTMTVNDGTLYIQWADPIRNTMSCRSISPLELITKVVRSITGKNTPVSIEADSAGLMACTRLVAGEELRQISDAKIYTTFGNFCDWIEAVFGYTYRMVGETLEFVHRNDVFVSDVVKVIDCFREFKFEVVDDLIYSQVEAGYGKKEYGEIDGRFETNFTDYYSTGVSLTDKKLSLISKYRTDRYGVEFTARKSESETKDDKADEDIFCMFTDTDENGVETYEPDNQDAYLPSVCVENNKAFAAVLGNGSAVTLTMTSSDGNNSLANIVIPAGTALFTAGEISFVTDDMDIQADTNARVQIDHDGYRYTGFIKEAEARFGRLNGVEYKLIVKDITAI